jgi:type III pantothenate kinase
LNLVIDIGNSRSKAAIFSRQEMVQLFVFEHFTANELGALMKEFPAIDKAILSAVSSVDRSLPGYLKTLFPDFIELSYLTPMPIRNSYKTPETLGIDRLAAAVGAQVLFPGKDLLVMDAGTAITFDLIEANGTFLGGNISPGLRSRFRALHDYTEKLPLVTVSDQWPPIGQTTEEAIRSGVLSGITLEMDGMIDLLSKKYPGIQIVLTGGDAPFFERRLKNHIFVKFEITLIGLNRILEYNVEKQ